jgi:hypothetical protein
VVVERERRKEVVSAELSMGVQVKTGVLSMLMMYTSQLVYEHV